MLLCTHKCFRWSRRVGHNLGVGSHSALCALWCFALAKSIGESQQSTMLAPWQGSFSDSTVEPTSAATTDPIELPSREAWKVHGSGRCWDFRCHSTMAWYEWLRHPNSFADDEHQVVEILKTFAARESRANPSGIRFHIECLEHSPKPKMSYMLQIDDDYITRTYSWLATPSGNRRYPVVVQNCFFSSSKPIHRVHYSVVDKPTPPEKKSWKRGYWNDPVWKQAPIQPGETSELMRKHKAQMAIWRGAALKPVIARTFDQLVQRDEERLNQAKERSRHKRQALLEDADDVVETKKRNSWCPPHMACIEKETIIWTGNHEHWRTIQFYIYFGLMYFHIMRTCPKKM